MFWGIFDFDADTGLPEATSGTRTLVGPVEFVVLAKEALDFPVRDECDPVADDGTDFALFDLAVDPGAVFAKHIGYLGQGVCPPTATCLVRNLA